MPSVHDASASPRHWGVLAGLTALVLAVHMWVTYELSAQMKALAPPATAIKRMEATYVSEIKLSAPPVAPATAAPIAPPAPQPARKVKKVRKPAKPASAPQEPASAPEPAALAEAAASDVTVAEAPAEPVAPPSSPEVAASAIKEPPVAAAAIPASAARSGPAFVWPKATRVTFKMEGSYRGPIYGQAAVEWIRQDNRYQVHLEASVGPSFAPMGSWRLTSEGEILPEGLSPRRYEHVDRLLFKTNAPRSLTFERDEVLLPNGQRVPRPPGMQDPASQFIQLAYRFIMNPELLKVGNTIEVPLALLRKAETIAYDVVGEETLRTPLGEVPTYHVKPRRTVGEKGDITVEIWFAPGLQYLPVRILARMSENIFMDMQMDRAPQQAPGVGSEPSAP